MEDRKEENIEQITKLVKEVNPKLNKFLIICNAIVVIGCIVILFSPIVGFLLNDWIIFLKVLGIAITIAFGFRIIRVAMDYVLKELITEQYDKYIKQLKTKNYEQEK